MASKTLIGGTAYEISGGHALVGGTSYSINKGRTLIGGTGYDINIAKPKWVKLYTGANSTRLGYYVKTTKTLTVPKGLNAIFIQTFRSGETWGARRGAGWFYNGNTGLASWELGSGYSYGQIDSYSGTTLTYSMMGTDGTYSTDVWGLQGHVTWVSGSITTSSSYNVSVTPPKQALFCCVARSASYSNIYTAAGNDGAGQYTGIDARAWQVDGVTDDYIDVSYNDMGIIFKETYGVNDGTKITFRYKTDPTPLVYAYCY